MMNSNDLMIDLLSTLEKSGWLDKANEFFRNHPEYFHPAKYSGLISNLSLSISYQPESLSAVADVVPSLYVGMGGTIHETAREIIQYKTGSLTSRVWIDGNVVTEVKI
jgi:hypothetical protein